MQAFPFNFSKVALIDVTTSRVVLSTIVTCFAIPYYFLNEGTILGFIAIRIIGTFFGAIGLIGMHRWLTHNSFVPSRIGKILMLTGLVLRGQARPVYFLIYHRMHHIYSDTKNDPHSPKYVSWLKLWLGRYVTPDVKVPIPRDFYKQKDVVFINKHYWKLWWIFNIVLAFIDLKTALLFCPAIICTSAFLNILTVYHAHNGGKENIEPVNLHPFLCFLTAGEALQKNHHDNPNDWNFGGNGRRDPYAWMVDNILRQR